jgi:hypothetical protein
MTTPELQTRPSVGSAIFQIGAAALLSAVLLVQALRGHRVDWFLWTLFLMIAASGARNLATGTRWRLPIRVLYVGAGTATFIGLVLAVVHDRTA